MGEETRRAKKLPPGTRYLIATMADTTWRMFVPTIGLLLVGLQIDKMLHSMPWGTLVGLGLGTCVTIRLVQQQLNRVKK